jgi:catechol 2,3-dioxygenase-like lactoylglutathione lyase family enzyme
MIDIISCNVTVMISSMDKSIKFYTDVLGLKLKNRFGDHWADIEGPGIAIGLHPTLKDLTRQDNLQIGLKVPDLDRAILYLEENGVQVKKDNDDQVKIAFFADPDNNTLYLVQQQ